MHGVLTSLIIGFIWNDEYENQQYSNIHAGETTIWKKVFHFEKAEQENGR
jgi:hypothetical protein